MGTLTVRGLDPEVSEALKRAAKKGGVSVNRLVLNALKAQLGVGQRQTMHHDLDHFFGSWSPEEHEQIKKSTRQQRRIDKELWK